MPAELVDLMRSFCQFAQQNDLTPGSISLERFAILDCVNEQLRLDNARMRTENRDLNSQLAQLRSENQDIAAQLIRLRHRIDQFMITLRDLGLENQ